MSSIFKKIAKSFKEQVFTRLFLIFTLLMLIAFLLMGFLIRYAVASIILEYNESYVKNSLFQMKDAFENSLKQIDSNVKYLYTSFFSEHSVIHYLAGIEDQEKECTKEIINHLSRLKNSSPYIVGVVL